MPVNHLTSSDIPQSIWWNQPPPFMDAPPQSPLLLSHHHRSNTNPPPFAGQNPSPNFNLNQFDDEIPEPLDDDQREERRINQLYEPADKEPMFEKPLTPSDVGKLNRLVIPKQHAEKYFPLSVDSGLLLSFEDESGKFWRFRYSYWNSSQSYVLTKGWSRFVKEKRLDAGDVVLFERHRVNGDRLFIGWRRRPVAAGGGGGGLAAEGSQLSGAAAVAGSGGGWSRVFYSAHAYPVHPSPHGASTPYQPDCLHAGDVQKNQTTPSGNSSKRLLRLFGVNMECQQPDESEPSTPDGSSTSSQGHQAPHFQYCINPLNTPNPQRDMMDINFSRGVSQRRYHQG